MIATQENAALALDGVMPLLSMDGSTRVCYILDDVVYKVAISGHCSNETEWFLYKALCERILPDNVRLPITECFSVDGTSVIAMQYIEGQAISECYCEYSGDVCDESCMSEAELDLLSDFIDDTSGANVIRTAENLYYLIDMA